MVMTNRDRVDRGMSHLASGLGPFVNKQMAAAFPGGKDWVKTLAARNPSRYGAGRRYSLSDPRFLLRVVTEEWRVFKDQLSRVEQGFATELKDAGNKWAHGDPFTADHEATGGRPVLLCEWDQGTFAIGLCADCGKPVCGDHSRLYQDRRLCIRDINAREEAAALAAAGARLAPEKFLALAAAVGNPGLRSWTVVQLGTKETTRRQGLFGNRSVVHTHVGQVGRYEIHGWALPCYVVFNRGTSQSSSERVRGLEALMLTEHGHINRLGHELLPFYGEFPTFEDRDRMSEDAIDFDYQFSDWPGQMSLGEAIDLALRELCCSWKIPI